MRGTLACFGVLVLVLLPAAAAGAQQAQPAPVPALSAEEQAAKDAKAKQLFEAGRVAYDGGHFDNAYENFRLSYELSDKPVLLFNIGMAAERSRRDAEALAAYERYLELQPDASNGGYVRERIRFLRESEQERAAEAEAAAAASTRPGPAEATADYPEAPVRDGSVTEEWWFWGAIGLGAVLVTTTIVVAASGEEDPVGGDVGGVIATLELE
ncbi:MAG: tetratricopeptide repeat protein [Myxococcales bacterium]|nr:tetratricopeptide repeat protein [Myxococcales bacterium]